MLTMRLLFLVAFISLIDLRSHFAQGPSETLVISEAIVQIKVGKASDEMLSQLDIIANSSSHRHDIARQTACFLGIRRGDYKRVWAVVSKLAIVSPNNENSLYDADQRLLLWLTMEAGLTQQASELIDAAIHRSLDIPDRMVVLAKIDARLLGVLCALASDDSRPQRIELDRVTRWVDSMTNHPRKSLGTAFRQSFDQTIEQKKKVEQGYHTLQRLTDPELTAMRTQVKESLDQLSKELADAKKSLSKARFKLKDAEAETAKAQRQIRKYYYLLTETEEPGRPKQPSSTYSGKGDNEDRKNRDRCAEYQSAMSSWTKRNNIRKSQLSQRLTDSQMQYEKTKKDESPIRRSIFYKDAVVDRLESELSSVRLLETSLSIVQSQRRQEPFKGFNRPSLYPCIDWSVESDRLLKELQNN